MHVTKTLLLSLFIGLISGCSGTGNRAASDIMTSFEAASEELAVCPDPIDRGKTWQVFFRLEKPTRCIRVSVISQFYPDEFTTKMKIARTYFTVDRMVDISMFNRKQGSVFAELGSNFTAQWDQQRDATICASKTDPLQKLDGQSIYRIRISTFEKESYRLQIIIYADQKARFSKGLSVEQQQ